MVSELQKHNLQYDGNKVTGTASIYIKINTFTIIYA